MVNPETKVLVVEDEPLLRMVAVEILVVPEAVMSGLAPGVLAGMHWLG